MHRSILVSRGRRAWVAIGPFRPRSGCGWPWLEVRASIGCTRPNLPHTTHSARDPFVGTSFHRSQEPVVDEFLFGLFLPAVAILLGSLCHCLRDSSWSDYQSCKREATFHAVHGTLDGDRRCVYGVGCTLGCISSDPLQIALDNDGKPSVLHWSVDATMYVVRLDA